MEDDPVVRIAQEGRPAPLTGEDTPFAFDAVDSDGEVVRR